MDKPNFLQDKINIFMDKPNFLQGKINIFMDKPNFLQDKINIFMDKRKFPQDKSSHPYIRKAKNDSPPTEEAFFARKPSIEV
ncbi:hypothetical protein [Evansella halocellulosilytica]|uniref:hypothetical protein n=1 Tax=Evansella halocellulosilytica TaxID=2011013 RepID=UPI000BB7A31B|nr:hypothetical protein [Evansella halocellulosilytica]